MHRTKLLTLLSNHQPYDSHEANMLQQVIDFVESTPTCFENDHSTGHITASAWVADLDNQQVGLIHHGKLNKWFQPGGHSDGNSDTPQESLREAIEEFGDIGLELHSEAIYDVDIHPIPDDAKRDLGNHLHYDIRFLVLGDSSKDPTVSDESHEAKWVPLAEVESLNNEQSIIRMVEKMNKLIAK